jgi:hypothetical protein
MTGCIYETGEQCCLLADDSSAQRRELTVAAPSIVRSTRVCGLRLGDQPIGYQSGEGPVQRAWPSRTRPAVSWSSKPMTAYPWLWPDASASKTWKPAVLRAGEALVELMSEMIQSTLDTTDLDVSVSHIPPNFGIEATS